MTKSKMEGSHGKRNQRILEILAVTYPDAKPALKFTNPFELLIATILSAQSTDEQVNKVTAKLFAHFKTPQEIAQLTQEELEEYVKGCGLYKNKSKNILATCKILVEKYSGLVPDTLEELMELPGVGRKTANVVLSNAFGQDAIAVDTHVFRVSNRLGLACAKDPLETEKQLQKNIPKEYWSQAHHWLIYHGRRICKARKPSCSECPLESLCPKINVKTQDQVSQK